MKEIIREEFRKIKNLPDGDPRKQILTTLMDISKLMTNGDEEEMLEKLANTDGAEMLKKHVEMDKVIDEHLKNIHEQISNIFNDWMKRERDGVIMISFVIKLSLGLMSPLLNNVLRMLDDMECDCNERDCGVEDFKRGAILSVVKMINEEFSEFDNIGLWSMINAR